MRKSLLLLLGTVSSVWAQPDLYIVRAHEYGTNFSGLIGRPWLQNFSSAPLSTNQLAPTAELLAPGLTNEIRTIMTLNVEMVNLGRDGFSVGNIFAHPERFAWISGRLYVRALWGAVLVDAAGAVVRERFAPAWMPVWDRVLALPGQTPTYSYFAPGISAAGAASSFEEFTSGALLDITGLPYGKYRLDVMPDPIGIYGQFRPDKIVSVEITINGFDVRPWPPPVVAPVPPPTLISRPSTVTNVDTEEIAEDEVDP